jgi:nucleoside-diphosphate-sugar epimerase
MRVMVLGAAGFLGRAFADACDERGWQAIRVDAAVRQPGDPHLWLRADLRDWLAKAAGSYDLVIHAAAAVADRHRIERTPLATSENLDLDAAVIRWAERTRPGRLVYLSSSAVYPVALQASRAAAPLAETDQPTCPPAEAFGRPDRVYGWAKLTGELLCAELRQAGVPVTIVRPFSGYGTGQPATMPFGAFIARARARADPFDIWGTGRQVRDFVHVTDIVGATLKAAAVGIDGPVNICTGIGTSMDELAGLICAAAGHLPATFLHHADQPTGVARRVGDPTELLGFYTPKVRLDDGIRMALDG